MNSQEQINNVDNDEQMDIAEKTKVIKYFPILMLGLDDAGKTSLLYKIKLGKDAETIATIGFNFEELEFNNTIFKIWDIGGCSGVRCLWKLYSEDKTALIFVVDASNPERFEEAKLYLHTVMANENFRNTTLLVVANKQDKMKDFNASEMEESFDLKSLTQTWRICKTCALGDWSLNEITSFIQNLVYNSKPSYRQLTNSINIKIDNQEQVNNVNNDEQKDIAENKKDMKDFSILIFGLDDAGKTCLLYKLKDGKDTETIETIGFNVEELEYNNTKFTIWDIGGCSRVRCLWKFYTTDKAALIYVVDSSNPERFEEAKLHLHTVMANDDFRNTPLLIVANKQDKTKDFNISEFEESLDLKSLTQTWLICKTCALGDWNLNEILQHLSEMTRNLQ